MKGKALLKKENKRTIFICWSENNSKKIASAVKDCLEKDIFKNCEIDCFFSEKSIASGEDWYREIENTLKKCAYGIICITRENFSAPWIFFEAGAIATRKVPIIPLLTHARFDYLDRTPISVKQGIDLLKEDKFCKMISDINKKMKLVNYDESLLEAVSKAAYSKLMETLREEINHLKNKRVFSKDYVYPKRCKTVNADTIFISVPMSSIDADEYGELRSCVLEVDDSLKSIGFKDVISPMSQIKNSAEFEGGVLAVKKNFSDIKQVESMIVIYPKKLTSSLLVEVGYGIALSKKMVIFAKDKYELPFILREAVGTIPKLKIMPFDKYSDIVLAIKNNGIALFEFDTDEE